VKEALQHEEWLSQRVTARLFLLLRFAITRAEDDHAAAIAIAREMDSLGRVRQSEVPGFFLRASSDVCNAIARPDDPQSLRILKSHVQCMEDDRLKKSFRAAVDLAEVASTSIERAQRRSGRANLWSGLRSPRVLERL
jgi:hypothetical protein